jgi:mRNA interferase MazF
MSFEFGEIILVKFPFTHLASMKKRPALVLRETAISSKVKVLTVAMITSRVDAFNDDGDVLLKDWKEVNLLHPSMVRLAKIATIEQEIVDKKIGRISEHDQKTMRKTFREVFKKIS